MAADEEITDLAEQSEEYGPRKVKTPNIEVEQFSPVEIQKAKDRAKAVAPTMATLHIDIAKPNLCRYGQ